MNEINEKPIDEKMVPLAGVIYTTMVNYYNDNNHIPPSPLTWKNLRGCPKEVLEATPEQIKASIKFLVMSGFLSGY